MIDSGDPTGTQVPVGRTPCQVKPKKQTANNKHNSKEKFQTGGLGIYRLVVACDTQARALFRAADVSN
jgi:hypothetical protein